MQFNARKCNIMCISNTKSPVTIKLYEIDNTVLSHVDSATYLGILLHKSLKFNEHINETANKCNRKLGFLKRNLRGSPTRLKETAYLSLVRSSAEYGGAIWDPHTLTSIDKLERVQRRAARWVCGYGPREEVSVSSLLNQLKWPPLSRRRKDQRLTLLFKIVNGEVGITPEDLGLVPGYRGTRSNHRFKFREPPGRTQETKNSCLNTTIRDWNLLPPTLAEADSLSTFKSRLAAQLD